MGNVFPPTQVLNNWRVGPENPTRPANKQGVRVYRSCYFYYLSSHALTRTNVDKKSTGYLSRVCVTHFRGRNPNSFLYRGFPDTASERRNGLRIVKRHRWAKRAHLYPSFCSFFTDLSCSTIACHSLGFGDEDFTVRVAALNVRYGGCTPPFALDGFALSFSSQSARCGLSFCFTFCLHPAFYAFANLTITNGHLNRPFSASNFDSRCYDLLHMNNQRF